MKNKSTQPKRSKRRSLPTLLAVGSSLAAFPAAAIELGDITVQSGLGKPLRASIAYALAPNEQIAKSCVTLRQGTSANGLPNVGRASISVANGVIRLTGVTAVREPMLAAFVTINCPYAAHISREYMVFVDPAVPAYERAAAPTPLSTTIAPAVSGTAVEPVVRNASRSTSVSVKDIVPGSRFQVPVGITASEVAARIEDRSVGLWPAVFALVKENPHAFVDGDPNKLKAGSWLTIPSFGNAAASQTPPVSPQIEPAVTASVDSAPVESGTTDGASMTDDLQPGIVNEDGAAANASESDNPFVSVAPQDTLLIPDTRLQAPETTSTSPNVATAVAVANDATASVITSPVDNAKTPSWMLWLAGSGIAIILGLILFGRRFRGGQDIAPIAPAVDSPQRRSSDTETVEAVGVDYDLSDDSPTDQNPILDANLDIGTGLESTSGGIDVADNFGFGSAAETDVELPFEPLPVDDMANMPTEEHSILESEMLPDDDDYDMSIIMDATKMTSPEEVTEQDLKAVVIDNGEEALVSDSYTISKEVDFQILEQDYEDEFTATQALNEEITRAAAELAERMDSENDDDMTEAMPRAKVIEIDVTSQLPAGNDDQCNLEETISDDVTALLVGEEATVEMPKPQDSRNDSDTVTANIKVKSSK